MSPPCSALVEGELELPVWHEPEQAEPSGSVKCDVTKRHGRPACKPGHPRVLSSATSRAQLWASALPSGFGWPRRNRSAALPLFGSPPGPAHLPAAEPAASGAGPAQPFHRRWSSFPGQIRHLRRPALITSRKISTARCRATGTEPLHIQPINRPLSRSACRDPRLSRQQRAGDVCSPVTSGPLPPRRSGFLRWPAHPSTATAGVPRRSIAVQAHVLVAIRYRPGPHPTQRPLKPCHRTGRTRPQLRLLSPIPRPPPPPSKAVALTSISPRNRPVNR